MSDLTPAAMAWLSSHHDVITTATLRSCGVGRSTIERLRRHGVLRSPHKGVYVLASAKQTLELRCAILCAAHPTGFVTGPKAGVMLALRRMPRFAGIRFAVRHGLHLPTEQGVVFHQTTALLARHVDSRSDGLRVARPARAAFDLAAVLAPLDHLSVLHQLVDERRVTLEELTAIGDELCHPARRGSGRFRESLARLGSGGACQSHPDVALCESLQRRDVPVERQTLTVRAPGGRMARIDLAYPRSAGASSPTSTRSTEASRVTAVTPPVPRPAPRPLADRTRERVGLGRHRGTRRRVGCPVPLPAGSVR